jgi:hypothetical protein
MVSVLVLSAVDRGLEYRSTQANDYKIGICYHCRQRALIENVSSTSGILNSGIFKEDIDDYRQFL